MNGNHNRDNLLEDISKWDTESVVDLLKKNGLVESCPAIVERRVDGKSFLNLTEQNYNSWKNDLAISSYWSLHRFVSELKNNPEQYIAIDDNETPPSSSSDSDTCSDFDPWATDFEDDDEEISISTSSNNQKVLKSVDQDSEEKEEENHNPEMQYWQNKMPTNQSRVPANISGLRKPIDYLKREEEVKTEEEDDDEEEEEDENVYANGIELNKPSLSNVITTKNKFEAVDSNEESNLTKLLQEKLRQRERMNKPSIAQKPSTIQNRLKINQKLSQNQMSFSNSYPSKTETNNTDNEQKSIGLPQNQSQVSAIKSDLFNKQNSVKILKKPEQHPPAPPKPNISSTSSPIRSQSDKIRDLPKPPVASPLLIGKLDLLADLPRSDKNVESMTRINSSKYFPTIRPFKNSIESVYPPQSFSSVEDEEEDEDEEEESTYESINEVNSHDQLYLQPRPNPPLSNFNNPLISKGKECLTNAALAQARENLAKRSPDKKVGTYSSSGSQGSLNGRMPRPLPPPPDINKAERCIDNPIRKNDAQSVKEKSWFHNVTRDQAEALISGGGGEFGSGPQNGYFLLRPSGNSAEQPFTLVLWYRNRPFNIPVRKRHDSRFALGSVKLDEQTFACVEEIVDYHKQKELVLHRNGVPVGNTRLTDTPPKRND